ncbi:GM10846 [Drosophila sechellia]|uniref:GM10846 n=1 Tax=Drosophila sechellia TaxID=7238 RepID=B4I485_DROSE|nr:GM10846 [Drosophila sechellia]
MMSEEVIDKNTSLSSLSYPKHIPEIKFGPIKDEMGFTLSERLALRQAWNLVRPFERRYGQDVFYSFLNDYYWGIKKFRNGAELNVKALHLHALRFINFFGLLIEEKDPVVFQLMINDNHHTHSRCQVSSVYIGHLAQALVDYVLKVFHKVSSPSLERGLSKLVEKFQNYQDQQSNTSGYNRLSKVNFESRPPRGNP